GEGTDLVMSTISYVLPDNVENLSLTGSDPLSGTGNALDNVIDGKSGDNVLIGGGGNDHLVGGDGDDTAAFSQTLDKYSVSDGGLPNENTSLGGITVSGPDGTDTVTEVEHLQFADGTIDVNDGNPLFDTVYYMSHNLDVFHAHVNALQHFNQTGW